jgi:hypothetical protein
MNTVQKISLSAALLATLSSPSFAFFDELLVGATSITNNLISSGASVTNNTVNTASTTMISLSSNPGKMADRVGLMADRIGFMADRIVTTEGIMAGLAHKVIDSAPQQRPVQQYASGYGYNNAPRQVANGNPYMTSYAAEPAPIAQGYAANYGYAQPDNNRYSASHMIYGNAGATYAAARNTPAPTANPYASGYGFSAKPAVKAASNICGFSYGLPHSC